MSCVFLNDSNAIETTRGFELHFTVDPSVTGIFPSITCENTGGGDEPASAAFGSIRWLNPPDVPIHMLPSRSSVIALLSVSFQMSPSSWVKLRQRKPSYTVTPASSPTQSQPRRSTTRDTTSCESSGGWAICSASTMRYAFTRIRIRSCDGPATHRLPFQSAAISSGRTPYFPASIRCQPLLSFTNNP